MAIPRIAITAGEPAGIGPDITIMLAQQEWDAELVVIANPQMMEERAALIGLPLQLQDFDAKAQPVPHTPGQLKILPVELADPATPGTLNQANAQYVIDTLQAAVDGCQDNTFQAMVTAPVQKSVINDAGIPFSGHTEFLAEATQTPKVVMLLATDKLRVALATTHLPLSAVPAAITGELLEQTLGVLNTDLIEKFGLSTPRIAVLGLNPHAGEGGHMGREEIDTIIPAMERMCARGLNLLGPLPADTAFNPKVLQTCDAVLAMYHDQGLPVLKYAGFGNAINITLGLPIIRTSVDHGTALDLAGSGKVNPDSLIRAIEIAIEMSTIET
ncbi:MAG: 4-hydroxythreonine-4-phosphate dehydrogenase PdxA [Halioglobus sp.]